MVKNDILYKKLDKVKALEYWSIGFILFSSLVVVQGWISEQEALLMILSRWISVDGVTAIALLLTGFCMVSAYVNFKSKVKDLHLWLAFAIVGLVLYTMFSVVTSMPVPFEGSTPSGGFPSWATLFSFMLFALGEIFNIRRITGLVIILIALITMIAYLAGFSFIYYNFPGLSSSASFDASVLLFHVGFWQFVNSRAGAIKVVHLSNIMKTQKTSVV